MIAFSLTGILIGLTASVYAVLAAVKQKERALLIALPVLLGLFLLFFLFGEIFIPH